MSEYYVEWGTARMQEFGMEFFMQRVKPGECGAKAHIHDSIEIIFVREGKFQIFVNDGVYQVSGNELCLFRSNTIHSIYAQGDSAENSYYVLKLKPALFLELASRQNAAGYVLRFGAAGSSGKSHWREQELQENGILEALENLIREYISDGLCKDISMKLCSCHVLLSLLRYLLREEEQMGIQAPVGGSVAEEIYGMVGYIHKNFAEDLNALQCSRMINMSYSYFSRCFKRIIGKSFKEYLNEVRINYAEHLLATTGLSVTQIALECGYNNVSYFTTVYKEMKKRTPLEKRKTK